jgi:hypothetical protein
VAVSPLTLSVYFMSGVSSCERCLGGPSRRRQ